MLRKPDDHATAYVRALAREHGDQARQRAARSTGIAWGLALGCAIGLAALVFGWL